MSPASPRPRPRRSVWILSAALLWAAAAPLWAQNPLSAERAAAILKANLFYDPLTGLGAFERGSSRVSFAAGLPWALLDWKKNLVIDPPQRGAAGLFFSEAALASLDRAFAETQAQRKSHYSVAAILIDPGHGGKDPGAVSEHSIGGKKLRVAEKDLTLSVALKLHKALKARYPERTILITRDKDTFPTLEARVDMANEVKLAPNQAIIYVSIHANAAFNKNAKGFEVWYLNPEYRRTLVDSNGPGAPGRDIAPILNAMLEEEFTTESLILAQSITRGLRGSIGKESPDRGVKAEEWFVVRNVRMPSVLVEMGYITNPDEARLLSTEAYLQRVADGVYTGIVDFVSYFEGVKDTR